MPETNTCNQPGCTDPRAERRSVCDWHGIRCAVCNGYAIRGQNSIQGRYRNDMDVCSDCYQNAAVCDHCDVRVTQGTVYYIGDDRACGGCYETESYYCSDCDIRVWSDGGTTHRCPRRTGLRAWDYRPQRFILHGVPQDDYITPTFGVELEVGVRGFYAGEMEALGEELIWAKRDGSVESADGYEGSELVSHPMTLDWFQGEGMTRWTNILDFVRRNGGVNRTCGMHVHASGHSIVSDTHLTTLMYLWNTNDEAIRRFCRRIANRYARTVLPETVPYVVANRRYQDRYALVNLTNMAPGRSGTVEFRGFAATTDPNTFQASVEIVAASIEFTREFAGIAAGADWDAFGHWIFNHGESYPALAQEWLVREVYDAYREVPTGLQGLLYGVSNPAAPYGCTRTGRVRQAPSEARRRAAAARYRDPVTGRLAVAPEGWTPPVVEPAAPATITLTFDANGLIQGYGEGIYTIGSGLRVGEQVNLTGNGRIAVSPSTWTNPAETIYSIEGDAPLAEWEEELVARPMTEAERIHNERRDRDAIRSLLDMPTEFGVEHSQGVPLPTVNAPRGRIRFNPEPECAPARPATDFEEQYREQEEIRLRVGHAPNSCSCSACYRYRERNGIITNV